MTYNEYETSRTKGIPVSLVLFVWGDDPNAYNAYTDADEAITIHEPFIDQEVTYEPIPISRGSIISSGKLDKAELQINIPRDTDFATRILVYPPSQVITCVIRQGHVDDENKEFLVVWRGRVLSNSRQGNEVALTGEPVSTSMRRAGLRRRWQYGCPHVLYGQGSGQCNADKEAATVTATVEEIDKSSVILTEGWPGEGQADKYLGGIIEWVNSEGNTEIRGILRVEGPRRFLIAGPPRGMEPSQSVKVVLGCNHQMSDCAALHNNIANFGGCPWIPLENPVGYRSTFY